MEAKKSLKESELLLMRMTKAGLNKALINGFGSLNFMSLKPRELSLHFRFAFFFTDICNIFLSTNYKI